MAPTQTTTFKSKRFMSTPLRDCELKEVPGVGPVTLQKLKDHKIDTAHKLVGHFLAMGKNGDKMEKWLEDKCEVGKREAKMIVNAIDAKTTMIETI